METLYRALAAVVIFLAGAILGFCTRNMLLVGPGETITGSVPADTVAVGMTVTPPDTVFLPKIVRVPGPERIIYSTEVEQTAPEVVPIDSVPEGPERDSALYAVVVDWNTTRRYSGTLIDDPRAGKVSYAFSVQYNRAGQIDYRFDPAPVVTARPRRWGVGVQAGYGITADGLRPYIGVGVQYHLFSF